MLKLLFIVLSSAVLVSLTNLREELHTKLFSCFGEIPKSMSSEELTELGKTGKKIPEEFYSILDFTPLSGGYIVPVGKVEKGNKVIILYLEVAGNEAYNSGKVSLTYKSIEKKSGEVYMSSHHLLDVGLDGDTQYSGSFELQGDDFIIFKQKSKESNGEIKNDISKYKFGRYLEFVSRD
ncbi:MAG: hypothetical protein R2799_00680 [Crocinitomicaceae bacterium]